MIRFILLCAVTLTASLANAADPQQITVWKLDSGYYMVSGSQIVAFPPSGPVVPPVTPPVVPPVVPSDVSKVTADLITALPVSDTRHKNAIKLAGTLKLLADTAKERSLDSEAIVGVYSPLMAIAVPDADWKHIHTAIVAGLKGCPSPTVCATTLEQYAAGAMSTVPTKADPKVMRGASSDEIAAAAGEYGFDWASIMEILLPLLMKLLMEWLSYVQFAAVLLC